MSVELLIACFKGALYCWGALRYVLIPGIWRNEAFASYRKHGRERN